MKNLGFSAFGILSILLLSFSIVGCVSEPVKINWPANHPANPETQEVEFIAPQNPFETNMAAMNEDPDKDSMMKHTMPKESSMKHMDHNMGTEKKETEHSEEHNHQQEHSQ